MGRRLYSLLKQYIPLILSYLIRIDIKKKMCKESIFIWTVH
jgi:hypothetical protein